MRKSTATVYWLIPAKPELDLFRVIIRILAIQFDAPQFEPHLTILIARKDRPAPATVLRRINASPIRLNLRGIGHSSALTKTLFVRVRSSKSLEKLFVDLGGGTKSRTERLQDPHISLIYKKLAPSVKRELASAIRFPFREIVFDSIKAVRCALPVRNRADVEAWRLVATKSLRK